MYPEPSVAMNGGTFRYWMMRPLTRPTDAPIRRVSGMACHAGMPSFLAMMPSITEQSPSV